MGYWYSCLHSYNIIFDKPSLQVLSPTATPKIIMADIISVIIQISYSYFHSELIEAKAIPEVKTIIDKAEAIATFTKQQNYSREIQDYANEFCIDAQVKLGGLIKDMPKNEGAKGKIQEHLSGTTKTEGPEDDVPATYTELGIDYKDASRWQAADKHSEAIIEKVAEVKQKGQPVTANRIINQVLQEAQKEERKYNQALPLPEDKYRTIVIDPPWPVDKIRC